MKAKAIFTKVLPDQENKIGTFLEKDGVIYGYLNDDQSSVTTVDGNVDYCPFDNHYNLTIVIESDNLNIGDYVWTGGDKLPSQVFTEIAFEKILAFRKNGQEIITEHTINDRGAYKKVVASTNPDLLVPNISVISKYNALQFAMNPNIIYDVEIIENNSVYNYVDAEINMTIVPSKNNFTRKEVEQILYNFANDVDDCYRMYTRNNFLANEELLENKWIEKNLK